MNVSKSLNEAYVEARTRLQQLTIQLTENDLRKTLSPSSNSIGFLQQHIADVELLFSKNVFKSLDINVRAKTIIEKKDTGEWTNLIEILAYLEEARNKIYYAIHVQGDNSWNEFVTTNEFGTKSKIEAYGRIISHTAYHTGQIALILKYGKTEN
jgi:uncharacterized damage-inducible protein DinB